MIHVVCAIIINSLNEVFCARRPFDKNLGGFWEFPGGKVEEGENEKQALQRELKEELELSLIPKYKLEEIIHSYDDFTVKLSPWVCFVEKNPLFTLNEHIDMKWLKGEELNSVEWCPADIPLLDEVNVLIDKKKS